MRSLFFMVVAAMAASAPQAGCFESGPLDLSNLRPRADDAKPSVDAQAEVGDGTSPTDSGGVDTSVALDSLLDADTATLDTGVVDATPLDTTTPPDTTTPLDTTMPLDTTPLDTMTPPDTTTDSLVANDTADGGGSLGPCFVVADCAGLTNPDRCAGSLRCIDYGCRPDPAGAKVCPGGDACTTSSCNPATGLCEERSLCTCEAPLSVGCGGVTSWSSNDPGGVSGFTQWGCGPSPAGGGTMRFIALPSARGRVRIDGNASVAGMHVLVADRCEPVAGCVAGGVRALYFDATPGVAYVVAAEEVDANQFVSVTTACDVTRESHCRDLLDDDNDAKIDCADPDCNGIDGCAVPATSELGLCGDNNDNDGDGTKDCGDSDCFDDAACRETCEVLTSNTYCNLKQGLPNGGGKARATHYACNPVPQTSKEVVFAITAGFSGPIRIGFQNAVGLSLHLLVETGRGCNPRDCVQMSSGDLYFNLVEGTTYYLAIDGPDAVVGNFNFEIDCEP